MECGMKEAVRVARDQGREAYQTNTSVDSCPYRELRERLAWAQGWLDAHFAAQAKCYPKFTKMKEYQ